MSTERRALCASCGYSWPVGQAGQHSCVAVLRAQRDELQTRLDEVLAHKDRLGFENATLLAETGRLMRADELQAEVEKLRADLAKRALAGGGR